MVVQHMALVVDMGLRMVVDMVEDMVVVVRMVEQHMALVVDMVVGHMVVVVVEHKLGQLLGRSSCNDGDKLELVVVVEELVVLVVLVVLGVLVLHHIHLLLAFLGVLVVPCILAFLVVLAFPGLLVVLALVGQRRHHNRMVLVGERIRMGVVVEVVVGHNKLEQECSHTG